MLSTGENHYPVNKYSGNQLRYPVKKRGRGGGRRGYCHIRAISVCVAVKGMVLKQFPLGYRVYKSESLGLE